MWLKSLLAASAAAMCVAAGTSQAAVPFETDVSASIDKGIESLASRGAYNNPSSAQEAAGLALLALLEKRAGTDLDAPPQGYSGASDTDQARMRTTVRYLLERIDNLPVNYHVSYDYGSWSMAIALYLTTGGPDRGDHPDLPGTLPYSLKGALDKMFDTFKSYQRSTGYWGYDPVYYSYLDDSSTTQFVMAGLAALRKVYNDTGKPWADAARLADLNAMAEKARQAYVSGGTLSLASSPCGVLDANERGHGYNRGDTPSLQQTASGTWIQLVGGADVNDSSVQGYLRWLRNRYRHQNITGANGGWSSSYWYYLWSSSKALLFIRGSGIALDPGNLGVSSIGTLPATSAPACSVRQEHLDPATVSRVALFGAGGAGYYAAEPKDFYFDYAYNILGYQCANGQYACNGAPGSWNTYSRDAYALLVLQRSVGGGCIDSDGDGVCDDLNGGDDEPAEALYCDANGNGKVDGSDVAAIAALLKGKYPARIPLTPANEWANYADYSISANWIDVNDYYQCWWVAAGKLPLKYYTTGD